MTNTLGFCFGIIGLVLASHSSIIANTWTINNSVADTSTWASNATLGLFFSQHSYSQFYKGGGLSSVALGSTFDGNFNYKKGKRTWDNRLQMRYGVIKMADFPVQKNDDHIELDSKYGYTFTPHLKVTGLFNFKTRMHDMKEISKTGSPGKRIGNFMSPAYFNLGSGIDYFTEDKSISIFYSPINSKLTWVKDDHLVAQYLPKQQNGSNTLYELGSLLRFEIKKEIMSNIYLHSIGSFFTNHLKDFGVFDVNIESKINFKINKLFSVNLLTQLIYDEDVLFDIPTPSEGEGTQSYKGPRTQFREVLNIGLSRTF